MMQQTDDDLQNDDLLANEEGLGDTEDEEENAPGAGMDEDELV